MKISDVVLSYLCVWEIFFLMTHFMDGLSVKGRWIRPSMSNYKWKPFFYRQRNWLHELSSPRWWCSFNSQTWHWNTGYKNKNWFSSFWWQWMAPHFGFTGILKGKFLDHLFIVLFFFTKKRIFFIGTTFFLFFPAFIVC